jgi:sugar (pentulose or hexulose) kinase
MGTGTIYPGDTCLTLGTNFAVRVVTGKRPVSDCFGYIVAPGQWAWVNSVPRVATQLDLVALALIETPADLRAKHFLLEELAAAVSPDSRLPCLSLGNHAALLDTVTDARHRGFSTGQTYLAMLHAVAVEIRHLVDSALSDGARATRFVATGGGVKNTQLLRVLSTTLGLPVEVGHPEAGLLGGGMVAAIGAGWYPGLPDAWRVMARSNAIVHPDPGICMRTTGEVCA